MKQKLVILAAVVGFLMTGCMADENKETISVPYSDMFKTSVSSSCAAEEMNVTENIPDLQSNLVLQTKAAALNQDIANTPIGDICFIQYKAKNTKKNDRYCYGYRVIFRTETDTYLLGTSPYKFCKWDDINSICRELEDMIETDCQMVGVPSLNDLELLDESQVYLPGRFEMWTSTPVSQDSSRAYYRNSKGSYRAVKEASKKSGVCAIIKVSIPQNDETLLSTSWSNYEELKSLLEAEEEQYIPDTSEE